MIYLYSVVGRVSPMPRAGNCRILEPLNQRQVLYLAAAPVAPQLPGLARPLPLRCTLPDLHQKPAKPTRAVLVVIGVISICYTEPYTVYSEKPSGKYTHHAACNRVSAIGDADRTQITF